VDSKTLARIGAVIFVAFAITAAVIDATRKPEPTVTIGTAPAVAASADPLASELARCGSLGEAGEHDAGCLAAWAKNRRRFLGEER
jgi:conjugative transfer region protein TrbK